MNSPWEILSDVAQRSQHFLDGIGASPVYPADVHLAGLANFDVPLQDEPMSAAAVVAELDRWGSPATTAIAGPRYFGFVNSGALPATLAANWLSTAWGQNGAFQVMSPGCHCIESIARRWVLDLLGLPPDAGVGFVTGTTVGDATCLAAGRDALLASVGWSVAEQGLFGAPPITVIVGDEVHATLVKALQFVGLGRARVVTVPSDVQGRMRADALPRIADPTIVCLQAGNVNTGSFDPFRAIAEQVRASDAPAWIHVDGAFGLWARAAPARAYLVDGIELADSWATDAHKWLNTPYDGGFAIVRKPDELRRTMTLRADYLVASVGDGCDYTPEASRRPRGVDVWAALRSLGRSGLAAMIERHCQLTERFARGFVAAGYPVLNDVVLNQLLVSFGDATRTREVISRVQAEGTCWCGPTVWQGHTAMRVSVIGWNTTEADVDRSLEAILRVARST